MFRFNSKSCGIKIKLYTICDQINRFILTECIMCDWNVYPSHGFYVSMYVWDDFCFHTKFYIVYQVISYTKFLRLDIFCDT